MGGELDGEKATQRGREGGRNSEKNRKPPEVDSSLLMGFLLHQEDLQG